MHTHTHRRVHTKRLPPHTPTDTQPHPSISMRMTGREPRVGGDAWGLTVTQPHAVKHSPDHDHPTHRNTQNPQTHAHNDTAHMITTHVHTHTHTPNTGTCLCICMQQNTLEHTDVAISLSPVLQSDFYPTENVWKHSVGTHKGATQAMSGWKSGILHGSPHYKEQSSPNKSLLCKHIQ